MDHMRCPLCGLQLLPGRVEALPDGYRAHWMECFACEEPGRKRGEPLKVLVIESAVAA